MENPLVSIIIPVYKVEKYIGRCLNSVMRQVCQGFSIECIIVDDCSPDDSMLIVQRFIENYSGNIVFKTLRHEENLGLSAARNTGLKQATGEFLFFIDSDDYITEDCLQKLTDVVKGHPEVQVVKGNHEGRGKMLTERIPRGILGKDALLELLYMDVIPVMAWNTLIKRSLVEQRDMSFKEGLVFEDNLWSVQLFRYTDSFVLAPDVTYHYDFNPDSIMGNHEDVCQVRYLPHIVCVAEELMNSFDYRHFVSYTCFVESLLMRIIDCIAKDGHVDEETCKDVRQLRNRLLKLTLKHGRLILIAYESLLYSPIRKLMRYRWFRKNYNRIEIATYKTAKAFDWIHFFDVE